MKKKLPRRHIWLLLICACTTPQCTVDSQRTRKKMFVIFWFRWLLLLFEFHQNKYISVHAYMISGNVAALYEPTMYLFMYECNNSNSYNKWLCVETDNLATITPHIQTTTARIKFFAGLNGEETSFNCVCELQKCGCVPRSKKHRMKFCKLINRILTIYAFSCCCCCFFREKLSNQQLESVRARQRWWEDAICACCCCGCRCLLGNQQMKIDNFFDSKCIFHLAKDEPWK